MQPKRKPRKAPRQVLVIRDPRDSTKDTWLPEHLAKKLFAQGQLTLINSHGDTWDYFAGSN